MGINSLPALLPWVPKSIYELGVHFDFPFRCFSSWCGRRKISEIRKHDVLPKERTPISPDQGFFDDLCKIATQGGIFEGGNFVFRSMDNAALLITAVLDFAAKRAIVSPNNGIQPSEHLTDFNLARSSIEFHGMEAWGLYKTRSGDGNPYMVALYLLPEFCRDDALEDFISTSNISHEPASRFGSRPPSSQAETMWCMVLDACVSSQCTSFVVSSYTRWVFGEFTTDFDIASVSPIMDLDSKSPSVPEALYHWTAHAFETARLRDSGSPVGALDQDEWPLTFMDMQHTFDHQKLRALWEIQ